MYPEISWLGFRNASVLLSFVLKSPLNPFRKLFGGFPCSGRRAVKEDDQSSQKSLQRVFMGSSGGGIEVITEYDRDKLIKIDELF